MEPETLSIGHLLEAQAARAPDAVAIEAPGRAALTYGRLARHVRDVVARLNELGIGRGDRVALALANGPEAATAFLAVAAGATCAPLNPEYLAGEADFYLGDLGARALVVEAGADPPALAAARARGIAVLALTRDEAAGIFRLDDAGAGAGAGGTGAPARAGFAECGEIALVLHTSGTTARPKMVPLSHANLMVSARSVAETLRLTPEDRCLNILPLFHIHGLVAALLAPLAAGGSVVCTPGFHAIDFFAWLDAFRPTWYTGVPTMHQAILARAVDHRETLARARLRFIRSSSAALPPRVLEGLEKAFGAPVIEAYGMTEAAHQMTSNPLPPATRKPGSVGPAAGPEVAIMDAAGRLLPPGERGEIVVRGPAIMGGYDHNPAANAEAFTNGWFRTGDQGILDADGYLTVTGRLKEIINRGGEKIAPREVDEVLLDHPAVAEAVTFALPDAALGEEVAAAVVLKEGARASAREITAHAAERLSFFKVPRRIAIVPAIPKGPTGKLQRIGLAERLGLAEAGEAPAPPDATPPRTPVERALAALWREVLRLDAVGVHARFLDLGGDSVLAAQLLARVADTMAVELSLAEVFDAPTIADMAARMEDKLLAEAEALGEKESAGGAAAGRGRARAEGGETPRDGLAARRARLSPAGRALLEKRVKALGRSGAARPVLPRREGGGPAPLSLSQEWWFAIEDRQPAGAASNRPSSLRLTGPLDVAALERALAEVVRRHEALRTVFPKADGGRVQEIRPPPALPLAVVDLAQLPAEKRMDEALRRAGDETRRPFDTAAGPLLRARLLRLGGEDHVLVLVIHHAVFDGWSMAVLVRELAALYEAFARGRPAPLAEPPIQYADFAAWQRRRREGGRREKLAAYWVARLGGGHLVSALPADRARPREPSLRGGSSRRILPRALATRVRALARDHGVTVYMAALAAFHALLARHSGREDVATGCLVSGRTRVETESLIGLFFNALVLRTDLAGDPTVAALVARARGTVLGALAHQEMPIGELARRLGTRPGPDESPIPLVPILFQMRNIPPAAAEGAGLRIAPFRHPSGMARFDMTFDLAEGPEGLACMVDYNADLFEPATIETMLEDFEATLTAFAADPDRRLSALAKISR